ALPGAGPPPPPHRPASPGSHFRHEPDKRRDLRVAADQRTARGDDGHGAYSTAHVIYGQAALFGCSPLLGPFLLIKMPFISGRITPSLQVAAQVYRNFQATFITCASEISQAGSSGTLAASFVL